jgi:hypothetical protein
MNRRVAKAMHEMTNLAYWAEKPGWDAGDPVSNLACRALRALPFSVYEAERRVFYDPNRVIAVNGETVVAANGPDMVDKFMFRYPGKMALEAFRAQVSHEVLAVTRHLCEIALPTDVNIKNADIFRRPGTRVPAVTQTQPRLSLEFHKALDLEKLTEEAPSRRLDKTAADLESLLIGTEMMATDHDYYPDASLGSGNLRRGGLTGAVSLLDVMPLYADGHRLIDDRPSKLPHTLEALEAIKEFIGQYGG